MAWRPWTPPMTERKRPSGVAHYSSRCFNLTPDQREVFVLKHVEGLSYGEIRSA